VSDLRGESALVVGSRWPIDHVACFQPRPWLTSGLLLLLSDAPRWGLKPGATELLTKLGWLLDEQPNLEQGIELAGEYGAATLSDDGVWRPDPEAAERHRRLADEYGVRREHEA
jgi:hypothetical protein